MKSVKRSYVLAWTVERGLDAAPLYYYQQDLETDRLFGDPDKAKAKRFDSIPALMEWFGKANRGDTGFDLTNFHVFLVEEKVTVTEEFTLL